LRIADCGLRIPAFRTRIILLNFIWFTHTFSFAFAILQTVLQIRNPQSAIE